MTPLFAAVDWLNISINLLLVIHVIICLLLALLVLMQRPKQEGLGAAFGSGLTDQAFGARTTDVLQKGTVYLGTLFFVVTLVLAILIGKRQNANPSMTDAASADKTEEVAPDAAPVIPEEKAPVVMPEVKKEEAPKSDDKAEDKADEAKKKADDAKAATEKKAAEAKAVAEKKAAEAKSAAEKKATEAKAAIEEVATPAEGANQ